MQALITRIEALEEETRSGPRAEQARHAALLVQPPTQQLQLPTCFRVTDSGILLPMHLMRLLLVCVFIPPPGCAGNIVSHPLPSRALCTQWDWRFTNQHDRVGLVPSCPWRGRGVGLSEVQMGGVSPPHPAMA